MSAVLVDLGAREHRDRLRRDRPVHPRLPHLAGQRRQVHTLRDLRRQLDQHVVQIVALVAYALGPQNLAGLDVDDPAVQTEIAVQVDEDAGDDVACAHDAAHARGGGGIDAAGLDQALLLEDAAQQAALDDAQVRVLVQLRQQQLLDADLERGEVLRVGAVGTAVGERQDGHARARVGRLPGERRGGQRRGAEEEARCAHVSPP